MSDLPPNFIADVRYPKGYSDDESKWFQSEKGLERLLSLDGVTAAAANRSLHSARQAPQQ